VTRQNALKKTAAGVNAQPKTIVNIARLRNNTPGKKTTGRSQTPTPPKKDAGA